MNIPVPPPPEALDKALLRQIKADKEIIDFLGTLADHKSDDWYDLVNFYNDRINRNLSKLRIYLL